MCYLFIQNLITKKIKILIVTTKINSDINFRKFQNLTPKQRSETTPQLCNFLKQIILKINSNKFLNVGVTDTPTPVKKNFNQSTKK